MSLNGEEPGVHDAAPSSAGDLVATATTPTPSRLPADSRAAGNDAESRDHVNRAGSAVASQEQGLGKSAISSRVQKYESMVAKEGELDAVEAEQIDEAFQEQLSPDDQMWAV